MGDGVGVLVEVLTVDFVADSGVEDHGAEGGASAEGLDGGGFLELVGELEVEEKFDDVGCAGG